MGLLSSPLSRLIALLAVTAASSAMLGFVPRQKNWLSVASLVQLLSTSVVVGTGNWVTFVAGAGGCASILVSGVSSNVLPLPAMLGFLAPVIAVSGSIVGAGIEVLCLIQVIKQLHAGHNAFRWQLARLLGSTQLLLYMQDW